jgi:transposase-like protein
MYKCHRFSPEIIQYAVSPHHRFSLSHREAKGMLAARGITVIQGDAFKSMGFLQQVSEMAGT